MILYIIYKIGYYNISIDWYDAKVVDVSNLKVTSNVNNELSVGNALAAFTNSLK